MSQGGWWEPVLEHGDEVGDWSPSLTAEDKPGRWPCVAGEGSRELRKLIFVT